MLQQVGGAVVEVGLVLGPDLDRGRDVHLRDLMILHDHHLQAVVQLRYLPVGGHGCSEQEQRQRDGDENKSHGGASSNWWFQFKYFESTVGRSMMRAIFAGRPTARNS